MPVLYLGNNILKRFVWCDFQALPKASKSLFSNVNCVPQNTTCESHSITLASITYYINSLKRVSILCEKEQIVPDSPTANLHTTLLHFYEQFTLVSAPLPQTQLFLHLFYINMLFLYLPIIITSHNTALKHVLLECVCIQCSLSKKSLPCY